MLEEVKQIFQRAFQILRENEMVDEVGTASQLRVEQQGMFEMMYGDGIALAGGMRSGSSPAGLLRCRYSIIDVERYQQNPKDTDGCVLGYVDLMMRKISKDEPPKEIVKDDGTKTLVFSNELEVNDIVGLVNIELSQTKLVKNRKQGTGTAVVKSLAESAPRDLVIFDIQKKAIGFWQKMGTEFYNSAGKIINPKTYRGGIIMGIIRKNGSTTPANDHPGFGRG